MIFLALSENDGQLVAITPEDDRFTSEMFLEAPAIVPNNDIKYHVGKKRARKWAFQNNKQICWILAKDTPAHTHLQERPYTETDKKRWLQYHDKNCDKTTQGPRASVVLLYFGQLYGTAGRTQYSLQVTPERI